MRFRSFNDQDLTTEFSGEEDILLDMINLFEAGVGDLLNPLRESVINRDANKLRVNAHTIKGVLANFYAKEGKTLAHELEKRGIDSSFEDALIVFNKLESELKLFLSELNLLKSQLINKS